MYIMGNFNNFLIRGLIALLLIVAATSSVVAQSKSEKILLTEEELVWINEHPTITAGSNIRYAPFDFRSAGEAVGISIDYLNLITSKVGLKVEYVNYGSWVENLNMGIEQKIDVFPALVKTEKRQEHFIFSDPYIMDDLGLWGRVGSDKIRNLDDLKDKRIGVIKDNSIYKSYYQQYPDLNYVEFNNNMDALRALSSNEIDVYPNQSKPVEFSIAQNNLHGIEIIGNEFIIEDHALDHRIAVHKNNAILMRILNKSMAVVTDQELEIISNKWLTPSQTNKGFKLTSEELQWLSENKIIKVAAEKASFPFEFINEEGKIGGFAGDFLNEIGKRLNVEFVWVGNNNWNDGLSKIRSGEADMVSGITPTKERQTFLEFSEAYLNLDYVIISRNEGSVFSNINTLDGRTIAQVSGTAVVDYLNQNYPNINILETENREEAYGLISSGTVDAMIEGTTAAIANISDFGFDNLGIVGTTPYSEASTLGVSSKLPLLSSAIQKAISDISPETRNAMFARWLTLRIETKLDYGPLYYVIGVAAFILILSFLWVTKLRQEVSRRIHAEAKATKASQAKSEFLASMSHDLRTPLNAIIGFSEALLQEHFGPLKNKKHVEYIDDIHSSGEYLLHLVNDILDLSTLEADQRKLNYEFFDIEPLLLECKNIVIKLAEDKNIEIIVKNAAELTSIYADRKALMQILMNLLSNAIKFTPLDGSITVRTDVTADNYIFQVSDTGCGISEESIPMITKPFTKATSSVLISDEGGTGLGLSIVQSLVDAHGGGLSIESVVGKGTTVTVSLPKKNENKLS